MTANYADKITHLTREELALEMFKATEKADPESMEKAVAWAYSSAVAHESGLTVDPNEFCSIFFESLANEASSNGAARQCNFHLLSDYEPAIAYLRGRYLDNDEWWEKYIANDAVLNEDFEEPIVVETVGAFVQDNDDEEPVDEAPAPKKKFLGRVVATAAALINKVISSFNRIVSKLINGVKKAWAWVTNVVRKVFHFVGKIGRDLIDKMKNVQSRMKSMPVLDIVYGVVASAAVAGVTTVGWNEVGKMMLAHLLTINVSRPIDTCLRFGIRALGIVATAVCASVSVGVLSVKLNTAISKFAAKRVDYYNNVVSAGGTLNKREQRRKEVWEKIFVDAQETLQEVIA